MDLFNATVGFIGSATNFGIWTSAIKEITVASELDHRNKISKTLYVYNKFVCYEN